MRWFALLLSAVVVVVLSSAAVLSHSPASAQEATPVGMAMATHPVVGTWEMTTELDGNTIPFLAMFHGDGTYIEIYPWGAFFLGAWKPTGERTVEGTNVGYGFTDDRFERGEGRWTAEVDATGNSIETDGTFVSSYLDNGEVTLAVEGPSPGTRLTVLPLVPLNELVPEGTPGVSEEMANEATPAP